MTYENVPAALDVDGADGAESRLFREAARRFARAGIGPWMFASFKLRFDPVYREILRQGLLPARGRIADLGCGQGLTLSAIRSAQARYARHDYPRRWPPPPGDVELHGYELRQKQAAIARKALTPDANVEVADLRTLRLPRCRGALLFDSLHYLERDAQERVLESVGKAVEPGGMILIREADAGSGFDAVRVSETVRAKLRGQWRQRFHFRSADEWVDRIANLGFETESQPMSGRTPFRNVLVHGVRTRS